MMRYIALVVALAIGGCASSQDQQLQMFVAGDIANATAIATAAGDTAAASCGQSLMPVAMPSPNPGADGLLTKGERLRVLKGALRQGPCAAVIAPMLLEALGKAIPFPANLLVP